MKVHGYKAIVVPVASDPFVVTVTYNGGLQTLQNLVGGYIEHVAFTEQLSGFVNEEGKLQGLPMNRVATAALARELGAIVDVIAGDLVLVGPPNDEGDNTDVDVEAATAFLGRVPVGA